MLKFYYVKSKDVENLQSALGRLIEYAKFLEEESGRSNPSFTDQIIEESEIEVDIQDNL